MAATPSRQGDLLLQVLCRCGGVLVRKHMVVDRCDRCHSVMKVIARVTLGPGGAIPHPDDWVPV